MVLMSYAMRPSKQIGDIKGAICHAWDGTRESFTTDTNHDKTFAAQRLAVAHLNQNRIHVKVSSIQETLSQNSQGKYISQQQVQS